MEEKTILVVDDDLDNVVFMETALHDAGFRTIHATDGAEGFSKAQSECPDCIVLDVQMPKMNGFEVFKSLLENEATRSIPVVMLTGIRDKIGRGYSAKDMKAIYGVGPNAYLEKPVAADLLVRTVRDNL